MTQLHTTRWVYDYDHNVLFNSGQVVCGMHRHTTHAVVVYGLDQQRGRGKGGGAEETNSLALTRPLAGDRCENLLGLCVWVRC